MKKCVISFLIIFITGVIGLGIKISIVKGKIVNGSREQYQHSFVPVSMDIEEKLYGVWQARGYAGHTRSSKYQWDGFWGDVVIICGNALIYGGTPYFNPVYFCYESRADAVKADRFLGNIIWLYRWDADWNGKVIAGIESGMASEFIKRGTQLNCFIKEADQNEPLRQTNTGSPAGGGTTEAYDTGNRNLRG